MSGPPASPDGRSSPTPSPSTPLCSTLCPSSTCRSTSLASSSPPNNFLSHLSHPHTLPPRTLLLYTLRLLLCLLTLELLLHYLYVLSLPHSSSSLLTLPLLSLSGLVYFTLNTIWLKFLCIWRFSRLFALLDGVEPVENMTRCVDNHHSVQQFWR